MDPKEIALVAGAFALSIAMVTAFSTADTGARSFSADVVNDADSYAAMEPNGDSPHDVFVSVSDGEIVVEFGPAPGVPGRGVNPNSTYAFDALINVTNKANVDVTMTLTFTGADSTSCAAALTSTISQSAGDYVSSPSLAVAQGTTVFLGLQVDATGAAPGDGLDCSAKITAS